MYQEIFNFNSRPFTPTPYVNHFVSRGPVKASLDQVNGVIARDGGPTVIVGAHGTGKSLLLALLADQNVDQFSVVSIACGPMTERRELLQAILFELKQPYREMTEGELRLSLIDFIKPTEQCPNGVLLLVDDAQALSPDLIDELRLITNFVRDGVPRVRLVMVGTDRLEETLTEPKLEPFNQRVSARCYLGSLTREETQDYIHEHIRRAGGDAAVMFAKETCSTIHELTQGCPRFINQLCEQSLIAAAERGMLVVEPNVAEIGWAVVQGIPIPEQAADPTDAFDDSEEWTVIEFGSLDDEDGASDSVARDIAVDELAIESTDDQFPEVGLEDLDGAERYGETAERSEASIPTEVNGFQSSAEDHSQGSLDALNDDQASVWAAADGATHPSDVTYPLQTNETGMESVSVEPIPGDLQQVDALIDVADSSLSHKEAGTLPDVVANPFSESFDSEEQVRDGFSATITDQNIASSKVTASELEHLQPPIAEPPTNESMPAIVSCDSTPESSQGESVLDDDDLDGGTERLGVADALLTATSLGSVSQSIEAGPLDETSDAIDQRPMSFAAVADVFGSMVSDSDVETFGEDDVESEVNVTLETEPQSSLSVGEFENSEPLVNTLSEFAESAVSDAEPKTEEAFEEPAIVDVGGEVVAAGEGDESFDSESPALQIHDVEASVEPSVAAAPEPIEDDLLVSPLADNEPFKSATLAAETSVDDTSSFAYPPFRGPAAAAPEPIENQDRLASILASLSGDSGTPSDPVATVNSFVEPATSAPTDPAGAYEIVTPDADPSVLAVDAAAVEPQSFTSPLSGSGYHEHQNYSPSAAVQRKANELMQSLALGEPDQDQVSHETPMSLSSGSATSRVDSTATGESGALHQPTEDAELSESQQILNEILEQKQLLSGHVNTGDTAEPLAQETGSYAFVQPTVNPDTTGGVTDDRDMVVGADSDDRPPEAGQHLLVDPGVNEPPVSTGQATRMDYEALFRQLRDVQEES